MPKDMRVDLARAAPRDRPTAAGRVFAILDVFRANRQSLTLSEICEQAGLSMTTTHRLVHELRAWGALERDPAASGIRYQLSTKMLALASSTAAMQMRERAAPHLSALHRYTGCSVHLGVIENHAIMYVESLRGHPVHSGANRVGGRLPLHVSAAGLVLLAYAEPAVRRDYLSLPLQSFTSETVTDPAKLERYLDEIRADGYVVARNILTDGEAAVAAPILDARGNVHCALGVITELDRQDPVRLVRPVRMIAHRISAALVNDEFRPDPRILDFQ